MPDDDRFKPVATSGLENGWLTDVMNALSDGELTASCDYRAAVRRARRRFERPLTQLDPQGPPVRECPRTRDTRGGASDYFWRSRDLTYSRRLAEARALVSDTSRPIGVFVHAHTHLADYRQRVLEMTRLGRTVIVDGLSPVPGALTPIVVNGGAWQRKPSRRSSSSG